MRTAAGGPHGRETPDAERVDEVGDVVAGRGDVPARTVVAGVPARPVAMVVLADRAASAVDPDSVDRDALVRFVPTAEPDRS